MESHLLYHNGDSPPLVIDMFHRNKLNGWIDFKRLKCTVSELKYFLTHFHSDHYGGIGKTWSNTIYTSHITGTLVEKVLGVNPKYICKLQLNRVYKLCNFTFSFVGANHCPGI